MPEIQVLSVYNTIMSTTTEALTHCPSANASALKRRANAEKRNHRIKEAFEKGYALQARPRKYTREYIISGIAEQWALSSATVEDIIYKAAQPAPKAAPAAAAA